MRAQFFLNKSEPVPAAAPSVAAPARKRGGWFGKFLLIFLFVALAGGLAYVGKLYWDAQQQLKVVKNDIASKVTNLTDEEITMLIRDVGKHITLPTDRPQVVTITNVEQLRATQPFFNTAQNGDKLLVFVNRVIIYRPSIDKVIDLAQIKAVPGLSAATPSATLTPTITPTKTIVP